MGDMGVINVVSEYLKYQHCENSSIYQHTGLCWILKSMATAGSHFHIHTDCTQLGSSQCQRGMHHPANF